MLLGALLGVRGNWQNKIDHLLSRYELASVSRLASEHLEQEFGFTRVQAERLEAAFALGRQVEWARQPVAVRLGTPEAVYRLLLPRTRGLGSECFFAVLLNARQGLIAVQRVSQGTLTGTLVHPREVFGPALRRGAAALVVAHNHPSGDPEPSSEDRSLTSRLLEAGRLVGVPLLDHIVLGDHSWVSLKERMGF